MLTMFFDARWLRAMLLTFRRYAAIDMPLLFSLRRRH